MAVVEKEVAAICRTSNTFPNLLHEYWIVGFHFYTYAADNALQPCPNSDKRHASRVEE